MEPETLERDLDNLKKLVHFDMICAVGGEPTLHPKLLEFLDVMRHSPIADKVVVVTNGSKLEDMPAEFFRKIDILRLSIYGRIKPDTLLFAKGAARGFGFELQAWEYPEFYKQLKAKPDDGVESFARCEWRSDCYTIHEGRFYLCPQSAFMPRDIRGPKEDGILIDDLREEEFAAYLNRKEPFEACKHCCAGDKIKAPWREAKKKDWREASTATGYIPSAEETERMAQ